jgi:hypothetical protein
MFRKLIELLFGHDHEDEITRLVRIEYPREYALLRRDGVVDFRPFVANVVAGR